MSDEAIWRGAEPLVIHCVGCPNYDQSLPPRPTPFDRRDGFGHPWCLLVMPGERLPPQHAAAARRQEEQTSE